MLILGPNLKVIPTEVPFIYLTFTSQKLPQPPSWHMAIQGSLRTEHSSNSTQTTGYRRSGEGALKSLIQGLWGLLNSWFPDVCYPGLHWVWTPEEPGLGLKSWCVLSCVVNELRDTCIPLCQLDDRDPKLTVSGVHGPHGPHGNIWVLMAMACSV